MFMFICGGMLNHIICHEKKNEIITINWMEEIGKKEMKNKHPKVLIKTAEEQKKKRKKIAK